MFSKSSIYGKVSLLTGWIGELTQSVSIAFKHHTKEKLVKEMDVAVLEAFGQQVVV